MEPLSTRGRCWPYQLFAKVAKNTTNFENNNYIFKDAPRIRVGDTKRALCYFLVGLVATGCYVNSLHGEFVHDDVVAIVKNPDVSGQTSLRELFTNDFWGRPLRDPRSHKSYRPLTVLSFRANHALGGYSPVGYHLVNVCLHAVCSLLLLNLCEHVVQLGAQASALAALLFAVHPVHTEAVSGVVGRAELLSGACFLMAVICYAKGVSGPKLGSGRARCRWGALVGALVLSGAAMLAKEQGIMALGVCGVYDVIITSHITSRRAIPSVRSRSDTGKPWPRRLSVIIVGASFLLFRAWLMEWTLPVFKPEDNPAAFTDDLTNRLLSQAYIWTCNLWMLVCPWRLSYDWQMGSIRLVESLTDGRNLATIGGAAGLALLTWAAIKAKWATRRRIVLGVSLLVGPFIPVSNIFFPVGFVMAERVLYMPSMGFAVLVACGYDVIVTGSYRPYLNGLAVSLLLLHGGRTIIRNNVWQSRETLFRSGLESVPHNAKMHFNWANYLKDTGQAATAIQHYQQALRLWPDYASAFNNMGTLMNDPDQAEYHYRRAIRAYPKHAGAYFNLGSLQYQRNELHEAVRSLEKACAIDPDFAEPFASLAVILNDLGRYDEAERCYTAAVRLKPHDPHAHNNLGVFRSNRGRPEAALQSYQAAYRLDPTHHLSMFNAARLLASLKRTHEAEILFHKATSLSRDSDLLRSAAIFYVQIARPSTAASLYRELLNKKTSEETADVDDKVNYAHALHQSGHSEEAERLLRDLVALYPNHVTALHYLSVILGETRRHNEALGLLQRALVVADDGSPLAAELHFNAGNHYKDLKQMEDAFEHYKMAVQLNGNIGEAHLNLGVFHHLHGSYLEARHHYQEAARLAPDNPLVHINMQKLRQELQQHCQRHDDGVLCGS